MAGRKPRILYHYCSLETFRCIMENRSIWLSDISKSNDSRELAWIKSKCSDYLLRSWVDYLRSQKEKNDLAEIRSEDFSSFDEIKKLVDDYDLSRCWAFCLTEKKDDLGQWRGYADDGRGVAIGFNRSLFEALEAIARYLDKASDCYFAKVRYSSKEIQNFFDKQVGFDKINSTATVEEVFEIFKHGVGAAIWHAPFFKPEKFKEEKEWRIAYTMSKLDLLNGKQPGVPDENNELKQAVTFGNYGHIVRNGELVSHVELKLTHFETACSSIIIGPKCKVSPLDMKLYLTSLGLDKDSNGKAISIFRSEVSYR